MTNVQEQQLTECLALLKQALSTIQPLLAANDDYTAKVELHSSFNDVQQAVIDYSIHLHGIQLQQV